jgi:hypothetical protein
VVVRRRVGEIATWTWLRLERLDSAASFGKKRNAGAPQWDDDVTRSGWGHAASTLDRGRDLLRSMESWPMPAGRSEKDEHPYELSMHQVCHLRTAPSEVALRVKTVATTRIIKEKKTRKTYRCLFHQHPYADETTDRCSSQGSDERPSCPGHIDVPIPNLRDPQCRSVIAVVDRYDVQGCHLRHPESELELAVVRESNRESSDCVSVPSDELRETYFLSHLGSPIIPLELQMEVVKSRAFLMRLGPYSQMSSLSITQLDCVVSRGQKCGYQMEEGR